jgi:hypothetical protein
MGLLKNGYRGHAKRSKGEYYLWFGRKDFGNIIIPSQVKDWMQKIFPRLPLLF